MITPAFALTATERVLPKLALDFITATLDPRITFTRTGGTATCVASNGYITSVAADVPRFDHNPVTLVCKGLLIEESRTNIETYSEDFSNAQWTKTEMSLGASVTSPDNATNGQFLIPSTNNAAHWIRNVEPVTSGTTYTFSIYAKAGDYTFLQLAMSTGFDITQYQNFDLSNGTLGSASGITGAITDAGNGWYRCSVTSAATTTASGAIAVAIVPAKTSARFASLTGNGTSGLYAWGAQLEAGAFATSYIPTEATALTRNADVATMTGTNFSDWFNATEGTFVILSNPNNITQTNATDGVARGQFCVSDGTSANRTRVQYFGEAAFNSSGLTVATLTFAGASNPLTNPNTDRNIDLSYKVNSFGIARNAVAGPTDTSGAVPSGQNTLVFGYATQGLNGNINGYIKKFSYYPQSVTSNELLAFSK
jgi:hypothetical protein